MKKNMILKAPEDVKVILHCGEEVIEEASSSTENGVTGHFYPELGPCEKMYWFDASGDGYYNLCRNIDRSDDDPYIVDANPGKMRGNGYEVKIINTLSQRALSKICREKPDWREKYADAFTTPTVSSTDKFPHEHTSYEEMSAYIDGLKGSFYRYSIGKTMSENAFEIPMLIFTQTDLSGVKDPVAATKAVRANGKLNIMFIAQIHGNEPAAGDNALAISRALCGEFGAEIIDKANVFVVPRVNPDGAKAFTRNNVTDNIDMNRDHVKVKSAEVTAVHRIFNALMPEVLIDGHEYFGNIHVMSSSCKEALVGVGGGVNTTRDLVNVSTKITNRMIKALNAEGLSASYYPGQPDSGAISAKYMINTANYATGRGYFSLKGSISVLVETYRLLAWDAGYTRRLITQFVAIKTLIEAAVDNRDEILTAVAEERKRLAVDGAKFSPDNEFCLYSGSYLEESEEVVCPVYDYVTGEVQDANKTYKCYYYDKAERKRPRATAFVIAKDTENAESVLEIVKKHDISFYELPADASMPLRRYSGTPEKNENNSFFFVKEAVLSDEQDVTFKNGAYVFPCNQLSALLLMYLFEPDVTDTQKFGCSFCQNGLLLPEDIYRYEHDLEK